MAMVQAVPTGRFPEAAFLPRGTEISVWGDSERAATFRTLRDLHLLPISIQRLSLLTLADGGVRFLLHFAAPFSRNDEIGRLPLHLNYFDDFHASLMVQHALRRHLRRVAVSFEDRVDETVKGTPCAFSFDPPSDGEGGTAHPLAEERLYFHFPRAELFLDIEVPAPPRNWQRFTLLLDVDREWPKELRLTKDVFRPFATPVVNLHRGLSQPIVHDGTRSEWPIRHPAAATGFALASLRGVYRSVGERLVPLPPGTLWKTAGSYAIEDDLRAHRPEARQLHLHLPEDFEAPSTVSVDAEWMQPWFSSTIGQKLRAAPYRQSLMGVDWEVMNEPVPHYAVDTADDFTQLMVLQNKPRLDREDLIALLYALGTVWTGVYAPLRNLIVGLNCREAPLQRAGASGGSRLIYELELQEFDDGLEPLVERFVVHLQKILDAWVTQGVEVRRVERR
jgi:type VI secretion system protein ImpG